MITQNYTGSSMVDCSSTAEMKAKSLARAGFVSSLPRSPFAAALCSISRSDAGGVTDEKGKAWRSRGVLDCVIADPDRCIERVSEKQRRASFRPASGGIVRNLSVATNGYLLLGSCPQSLAVMLTFFWSASERGEICGLRVDSDQKHIGMTGLFIFWTAT